MEKTSSDKGLYIAASLVAFAMLTLGGIEVFNRISFVEPIQPVTAVEQDLLQEVFPDADLFATKSGEYPNHKAYKSDEETGETRHVGFVFLTTDVVPDERAYGGPIDILVGMTTDGVLTGIRVVKHREPWGPFFIERKDYAPQFIGKSVLDPFEVGEDIDAVTRVTLTMDGAARAIRKSARQIARQYLSQ